MFDVGSRGQERSEMFCYADGTDAWAAAAMWNAEGFVQVQMADVGTDIAWPAKTDLRVHVRAVHVNLTAVTVHDVADFPNRSLENAVGARIGDHQRCQIVCMRVGLCPQIGQINVPIF